jgi:hypothetical protein
MNKFFLIAILVFVITITKGQSDSTKSSTPSKNPYEIKTIFGGNHRIGGYGSFSFGYSQSNNTFIPAGRGGIILSQQLALGLAGKGFSSMDDLDRRNDGTKYYQFSGGYGGILVEPIILPRSPIHIAFPMIVGVGGVGSYYTYYDSTNQDWKNVVLNSDAFFVFEPGIELELNITRFFRLAFGVNYRFTSPVNIDRYSKQVLDGFSANIVFKFGKF